MSQARIVIRITKAIQRFLRQKIRLKAILVGALLFCIGNAFASSAYNDYRIPVVTTDQSSLYRSVGLWGNIWSTSSYGEYSSSEYGWNNGQNNFWNPSGGLTNSFGFCGLSSCTHGPYSQYLCYGDLNWNYVVRFDAQYNNSWGTVAFGSSEEVGNYCVIEPNNTLLLSLASNRTGAYQITSPLPMYSGGSDSTVFGMLNWENGILGYVGNHPVVFIRPYKFSAPSLSTNYLPSFIGSGGGLFTLVAGSNELITTQGYFLAGLSTSFAQMQAVSLAVMLWNDNGQVAYAVIDEPGTVYYKGYVQDFWGSNDMSPLFQNNTFLNWSLNGAILSATVMGYGSSFQRLPGDTLSWNLLVDDSVVLPPPPSGGGGSGGGDGGDGDDGFVAGSYLDYITRIENDPSYRSWINKELCVVEYSGDNYWLSDNYSGGWNTSLSGGLISFANWFNASSNTVIEDINSFPNIFNPLDGLNDLKGLNNAKVLWKYCYAQAEIFKGNGDGIYLNDPSFPDTVGEIKEEISFSISKIFAFFTKEYDDGKAFFNQFGSITCFNDSLPIFGKKRDIFIFLVFFGVFIYLYKR